MLTDFKATEANSVAMAGRLRSGGWEKDHVGF